MQGARSASTGWSGAGALAQPASASTRTRATANRFIARPVHRLSTSGNRRLKMRNQQARRTTGEAGRARRRPRRMLAGRQPRAGLSDHRGTYDHVRLKRIALAWTPHLDHADPCRFMPSPSALALAPDPARRSSHGPTRCGERKSLRPELACQCPPRASGGAGRCRCRGDRARGRRRGRPGPRPTRFDVERPHRARSPRRDTSVSPFCRCPACSGASRSICTSGRCLSATSAARVSALVLTRARNPAQTAFVLPDFRALAAALLVLPDFYGLAAAAVAAWVDLCALAEVTPPILLASATSFRRPLFTS